jgi:hypothetical protein
MLFKAVATGTTTAMFMRPLSHKVASDENSQNADQGDQCDHSSHSELF